jgi:hypothetical protein
MTIETKFVGGPMHAKSMRVDVTTQFLRFPGRDGGRNPVPVEYVRRVWAHDGGRLEFVLVLSTLTLGEAFELCRQVMPAANRMAEA